MITISADKIEANSSAVLYELKKGERVGITFGANEIVQAYLVPGPPLQGEKVRGKQQATKDSGNEASEGDFKMAKEGVPGSGRRRIGIYNGMPGYYMSDDFCISMEDEFDI